MRDQSAPPGNLSAVVWLVGSLVLLVFLPLILANVEYFTLGTRHIEDFCRQIGVYDLLTKLYKPIFRLVYRLFGH